MNTRLLGQTGMRVSEVGLGCWQLDNTLWGGCDKVQGERIVHTALDAGCNFFDTAPGYGEGRSETLLGRALAGRRAKAIICSKFGHPPEGDNDFSVAALRPSVEASLRRLKTDFIDILLLHNPPAALLDGKREPALFDLLQALQREGKVRFFGASVDWSRELRTVTETTLSQAAEIHLNIFHQEPVSAFAGAAARGIGLIVKVPLDSGWLSGKYGRASVFKGIRNRWSPEVIERRAGLVEKVRGLLPAGMPLPLAALRFVLAHPEVSTVIPGAKDLSQLQANLSASLEPLPAATVAAFRKLWQDELQGRPLPW
jgi:aryl-alcohol dehydrogenase-like predicted oxidoreductase